MFEVDSNQSRNKMDYGVGYVIDVTAVSYVTKYHLPIELVDKANWFNGRIPPRISNTSLYAIDGSCVGTVHRADDGGVRSQIDSNWVKYSKGTSYKKSQDLGSMIFYLIAIGENNVIVSLTDTSIDQLRNHVSIKRIQGGPDYNGRHQADMINCDFTVSNNNGKYVIEIPNKTSGILSSLTHDQTLTAWRRHLAA